LKVLEKSLHFSSQAVASLYMTQHITVWL